MERKENSEITVFNLVAHTVFINDNGAENWFTLDRCDTYFDWDADFNKMLTKFNEFKLNSDDVDVADGVEKILYAVTIPTELCNNYKNEDDFYEYVMNHCDYTMTEIVSEYKNWIELFESEGGVIEEI